MNKSLPPSYLAYRPGMRVEVDRVVVALQSEIPPSLNVRDLHGVADRLHVAGRGPRLRPEERRHAGAQ